MYIHRYSCSRNNAAIVDALRSTSEKNVTGDTVIITAANFSTANTDITLSVKTAADSTRTVFSRSFNLAAEQKKTFDLEIPHSMDKDIIVELAAADDCITEDSTILLVPEPVKTLSYAVTLDSKDTPPFDLALKAAGAFRSASIGEADLIVTRNDHPAQPDTSSLQVIKGSGKTVPTAGPFTILLDSPLCRDTSLSGVYWGFYQNISAAGKILPLISAGSIPLYWKKDRSRYVMNFSPSSSNLQRLPCWPALIANLADDCRKRLSGLHKANYRGKEELRFNAAPEDEGKLFLTSAESEKSISSAGIVPLRPGVYSIIAGEKKPGKISVNLLSAHESNLSETAEETTTTQVLNSQKGIVPKTVSKITLPLLLAALILLLLNWRLDRRSLHYSEDRNII
jgi:hypothetical protein